MRDGKQDEKRRCDSRLNQSCNYLFATLIFPTDSHIELDRTQPTVTHAGTVHALFTG